MKGFASISLALVMIMSLSTAAAAKEGNTRFGKAGTITGSGAFELKNTSTTTEVSGFEADSSTFNFKFIPQLGYFVINGLELKVGPIFNYTSWESDGADSSYKNYGLTAGAAYHHLLQGTTFLTIGANLGYIGDDNDTSSLLFGAQAGVTLAFGGKFGGFASLLAVLDYVSATQDVTPEVTTTNLGFGVMTALGIFL